MVARIVFDSGKQTSSLHSRIIPVISLDVPHRRTKHRCNIPNYMVLPVHHANLQENFEPILQRLRQMRRLDLFTPSQVSDRPCQLQHSVIPSR